MPNKILSGFKAFKMVLLNVCIALSALVHTNTTFAQNALNLSAREDITPLISNLSYIYPFLFNRQKPVVYLDGKRLESSSSDQVYINTRRNDSLSVHYIRMDYLLKVLEMQGICREKSLLAGVTVPTLIMHGGEDKISSIKGSRFLNRNLLNSRTELIIYPNSKHSIFWDTDSIRAVRDMINWISKN